MGEKRNADGPENRRSRIGLKSFRFVWVQTPAAAATGTGTAVGAAAAAAPPLPPPPRPVREHFAEIVLPSSNNDSEQNQQQSSENLDDDGDVDDVEAESCPEQLFRYLPSSLFVKTRLCRFQSSNESQRHIYVCSTRIR